MRRLIKSFAGGEITPELYGRVDLGKFQTGVALAKNFWILPHGAAQNRPGFRYVGKTYGAGKARLLPFTFNDEQTYVLEFTHQRIRFYTQGGSLLETGKAITGITRANPGVVTAAGHGFSGGHDQIYLSGIGGMTELNGRTVRINVLNANQFELLDLATGAGIDTSNYGTYTSGGTAARVYTIAAPYSEADLFDLVIAQSADVVTITHPGYAVQALKRLGPSNWSLEPVTFGPTISAPSGVTLTVNGTGGTPVAHTYVATAIKDRTQEESLASPEAISSPVDLTISGNYVDVTPNAVQGALRYNVYKKKNGLFGYIGQTSGTLRDNNIVPDMSKTPPQGYTPFSSEGNYPAAVGYAGGRKCYGGSNSNPQTFVLSRSGTEANLSYSVPTRDDDSIEGTLLSTQVNRIQHILTLRDMVLLSSGGAWVVAPSAQGGALTPANVYASLTTAEGAARIRPVQASNAILYASAGRDRVLELRYSDTAGGLVSADITVLATHLFRGYVLVDAAYTGAPNRMAWFVRNDGALLGLTYLPEHDLIAWHQHYAADGGQFESVTAVREGLRDVLYAVVRRVVNGVPVRYVERMEDRIFQDPKNACFLDSSLVYQGVPTTTVGGLWHLEGKSVAVLADGGTEGSYTVSNGRITLPFAASTVQVGLPYVSDLQTLPLSLEAAEAMGQGTFKSVERVHLRVFQSTGMYVGPSFSLLKQLPTRTTEPYGSPPELKSTELSLLLPGVWTPDGQVCVRQTLPLPVTVLSMTLEVSLGN